MPTDLKNHTEICGRQKKNICCLPLFLHLPSWFLMLFLFYSCNIMSLPSKPYCISQLKLFLFYGCGSVWVLWILNWEGYKTTDPILSFCQWFKENSLFFLNIRVLGFRRKFNGRSNLAHWPCAKRVTFRTKLFLRLDYRRKN